jgi:hypothetical protein
MGQQVFVKWKQAKKKWKKLMFRERVQSQSNEPLVTKDSRIVVLLWSFSVSHTKEFWDEIFCNMLLEIYIYIFSIHHIFCINFSGITNFL